MLIHLAGENRQIALDYREKAPSAAHRDMFLTKDGTPDPRSSRYTRLASGVSRHCSWSGARPATLRIHLNSQGPCTSDQASRKWIYSQAGPSRFAEILRR
jgi:hypothetical protein